MVKGITMVPVAPVLGVGFGAVVSVAVMVIEYDPEAVLDVEITPFEIVTPAVVAAVVAALALELVVVPAASVNDVIAYVGAVV